MANSVSWARVSFAHNDSLVLEVGGVRMAVSQYTHSFAVDEIPRAACLLAVGRDAHALERKAAIHEAAAGFRVLLPAKVYAQPIGEWSPGGPKWPEQPVVIFDGYFTGFGFIKVLGKVQAVAHLVHWVSDLGSSSILSRQSHPASMPDLTFEAVHLGQGAGAGTPGTGGQPPNLAQHIDHDIISTQVQQDVWGAMKDFFCALAAKDLIDLRRLDLSARQPNDEAIAALKRMPGGTLCEVPPLPNQPSYYSPLKFTDIDLADELGSAVTQHIRSFAANSLFQMTFWDVIVGVLGPTYQFKFVPMVERGIIAAFTPGLRSTWDKQIRDGQYSNININSTIFRPLKAVGVHARAFSRTGIGSGALPKQPNGSFFVDDAKGMVLHVHAPAWMSQINYVKPIAGRTTGVKGLQPVATSTTPRPRATPEGTTMGQIIAQTQNLYDRFAQSIFIAESLRGRTGTVGGILRFDIAPGSNIRIEGSQQDFLGGQDKLETDLFGTVARVSTVINAEANQAGTSFQLVHVRCDEENTTDAERTSIERHPFYGEASFRGAPLVHEYLFPEV